MGEKRLRRSFAGWDRKTIQQILRRAQDDVGEGGQASAAEAAGGPEDAMAGLKPGPPEKRRHTNPMAALSRRYETPLNRQ